MDDSHEAYVKDPRIPCQYGRKCYQKNSLHHKKYKHPFNPKRKINSHGGQEKRQRINQSGTGEELVDISNAEVGSLTGTSVSSKGKVEENENTEISVNNGVSSDSEDDQIENLSVMHESEKLETITESLKQISNDVSDSESDEDTKNSHSISLLKHEYEGEANGCNALKNSSICTDNNHKIVSAKIFIRDKFLIDMPEDCFQFFEFCVKLNKSDPCQALTRVGLKLVGPYDVLAGKFCGVKREDHLFLIHWRYFYDPPQMQTVLKGDDKTGYHIGYFRDSPEDKPIFMVENHAVKNGVLTVMGENIFAAVRLYLDDRKQNADPFNKLEIKKISNLLEKEAQELELNLSRTTKNISKRNNKILSRTFNKIGLVVPYVRKTQLGYRKLAMSDKDLDALLTKIQYAQPEEKQKLLATLQAELLTWTDIASDECDFGTGIELGWNILCHGVDLNNTIARLLVSNFQQLNWNSFAKIAEAHMTNRKKGSNLSII